MDWCFYCGTRAKYACLDGGRANHTHKEEKCIPGLKKKFLADNLVRVVSTVPTQCKHPATPSPVSVPFWKRDEVVGDGSVNEVYKVGRDQMVMIVVKFVKRQGIGQGF